MKKTVLSLFLSFGITTFSQTVSDLKFDANIIDSEDSYVVLPKNESDSSYSFGFIYFDEYAGYTFRSLGDLIVESNKLKLDNESQKNSIQISRIGNFNLKIAKLDQGLVSKFNLDAPPKWLNIYKSSNSENEKILNRASKLNGVNNPQLALPKLLQLYKNDFKTEALFFELIFSYNALRNFADAEKISVEAIKSKKADDLVKKEYVYALLNQNKVKEAENYLTNNLSSFAKDSRKIEAMINIVAYSAHFNDLITADKWLKELKLLPNISRYQKNIDQLENIIKEKQSKIL